MFDLYASVLVNGVMTGVADTRKLKISAIMLPVSADPTEGLPLWDSYKSAAEGIVQVEKLLASSLSPDGKVEAIAAVIQAVMKPGAAKETGDGDV